MRKRVLGFLSFLLVCFLASGGNSFAQQASPIIKIEKFERTDSALVIYGQAKTLPIGTKIWATVIKVNSKKLSRYQVIEDKDVQVEQNGSFKAVLKRFKDEKRYNLPDGAYEVEFSAQFNRAWQSIEVAKSVGVELDNQGRSVNAEPRLLPKSSDLVYQPDLSGKKVRVLQAKRTLKINSKVDARDPAMALKTKKIRVEVNDNNSMKNPVKSFDGTSLSADQAASKAGALGRNKSLSVLCYGDFNDGRGYRYIADDLVSSVGAWNREYSVNRYTMLMDVCAMQEENFASRNTRRK